MTTRVGHVKHDPTDVYIGRGSPWGNPYVAPGRAAGSKYPVTESEDPLGDYERHVLERPDLVAKLPRLRGLVLGCFCVRLDEDHGPPDERCHGHVLARLADMERCDRCGGTELVWTSSALEWTGRLCRGCRPAFQAWLVRALHAIADGAPLDVARRLPPTRDARASERGTPETGC